MVDFTIQQRTEHVVTVTMKDINGTIVDISGATAKFIMSAHVNSAPIVTLTTSDDIALTDPTNGVLAISLSDTHTDRRGTIYYECALTDNAGNRSIPATGKITFTPTNSGY